MAHFSCIKKAFENAIFSVTEFNTLSIIGVSFHGKKIQLPNPRS